MHRILCISPVLVPIADSESFCGAKMALALMSDGIDVRSIYMIRNDPWLTGRHENSEVWNPVLSGSVGVKPPPSKKGIASVFAAVRYKTDSWARWIEKVVEKAADLHRDTPFDMVYSRSLPFYAHVAGFWVSKDLDIPWVANVNDPWDFHLFPDVRLKTSFVHRIASKFWLQRTLKEANLVTYPSAWLRDYTEKQAGTRSKSAVVPHIGWRSENGRSNNLFALVHTGKTGVNEVTGRSPLSLLKALQSFLSHNPEAISVTKVIFVGPFDPQIELLVEQMGLTSAVTFTGWVSYEESLKYIGSASACVLIEGEMGQGIYLPSKLADYIISEKPVLALSPAIGTVADISNEGQGIIRCGSKDEQAIEDAITELYFAFKNGNLNSFKPNAGLVHRFQPKTISLLFQQVVESATELKKARS